MSRFFAAAVLSCQWYRIMIFVIKQLIDLDAGNVQKDQK